MTAMQHFSYYLSALVLGAVFICASTVQAQAPIIDASRPANNAPTNNATAPAPQATTPTSATPAAGINQSEVFYQLQLLQQEVMQLRGLVEEQAFKLRQVKEENMERYINLDRRLADFSKNATAASASTRPAVPAATTRSTSMPVPSTAGRSPATTSAQQGEKGLYDAAYGLVINKRFDEALEAFKRFLVDYPDGKYAPNSYYWMGELYQVIKPQDLDASRQAFAQLLNQYPAHSKAADAMYKLGKVHFLMGNKDKSRQWLDKVVATYSGSTKSSAADKARQFISDNL